MKTRKKLIIASMCLAGIFIVMNAPAALGITKGGSILLVLEMIIAILFTYQLDRLMELEEGLFSSEKSYVIEAEKKQESLVIIKLVLVMILIGLHLARIKTEDLELWKIILDSVIVLLFILASVIRIKSRKDSRWLNEKFNKKLKK